MPIERGAVGPVTSWAMSISFEGIAGVAISRIAYYRIASHRKCGAINAMLTATQTRTHARTCTEPPIVRSSRCVAEPSLTAAPTDELMGNVCQVAGIEERDTTKRDKTCVYRPCSISSRRCREAQRSSRTCRRPSPSARSCSSYRRSLSRRPRRRDAACDAERRTS